MEPAGRGRVDRIGDVAFEHDPLATAAHLGIGDRHVEAVQHHRDEAVAADKEHELADVAERLPADHYVFVDDKVRLLTAVKAAWGTRVTTVWPRQGHYALEQYLVSYVTSGRDLVRLASPQRPRSPAVIVAGLRNPCAQINDFQSGLLKEVIGKDGDGNLVRKGGVMAVVLRGGPIRAGQVVGVELPPPPYAPLDRV